MRTIQYSVLTIGNLKLEYPFFLAPMAGITDLPFRLISRKFGCGLAFAEMISTRACVEQNRRTLRMLRSSPQDQPLGVQLLGSEPDLFLEALEKLADLPVSVIDVNAACPVPKVTAKGMGAALMKEPDQITKILKPLASRAAVPVFLKIRSGWNEQNLNAPEVARAAEDAGASAIVVHGRTRMQGYAGPVDYAVIKKVKESVNIPVFGSGNILNASMALKMFSETGCDGVAVARGALGNPWIFRELTALRKADRFLNPGADEIATVMREHLDACLEFYGPIRGVMIFRKLFSWYIRGFHEIRQLKEKGFGARTADEMMTLIYEFRERHALSRTKNRETVGL